jgi:hypothetical protein
MARQNLPPRGSFAAAGAPPKVTGSKSLSNKINPIDPKNGMAPISHS